MSKMRFKGHIRCFHIPWENPKTFVWINYYSKPSRLEQEIIDKVIEFANREETDLNYYNAHLNELIEDYKPNAIILKKTEPKRLSYWNCKNKHYFLTIEDLSK